MNKFEQLARTSLAQWKEYSHVTKLFILLANVADVDAASQIIREAADEMHEFAQANRGSENWVTYCLIMGGMRTLNSAIWRLDE